MLACGFSTLSLLLLLTIAVHGYILPVQQSSALVFAKRCAASHTTPKTAQASLVQTRVVLCSRSATPPTNAFVGTEFRKHIP